MATHVLIHGASSDSWYWHRVVPELQRLGHDVVAPDLPSDDDAAGPTERRSTMGSVSMWRTHITNGPSYSSSPQRADLPSSRSTEPNGHGATRWEERSARIPLIEPGEVVRALAADVVGAPRHGHGSGSW